MNKMELQNDGTYTARIDRQTKGGSDDPRNKNRRLERQMVINVALGGEHLLGNKVEMDWGGSFSRASEFRPEERYLNMRIKKTGATQDLTDTRFPVVNTVGEELDKFKLDTLSESEQMTYENEWGAKLNFRLPMSIIADRKGRLRFGTKLRIKEKDRSNNYFKYEPINNNITFANIEKDVWEDPKFLNGKGYKPGTFGADTYLGALDLNNPTLFKKEDVLEEYWTSNYNAKENIYSGFVRWDQNITDKLLIITGLRIEHTTIDYIGRTLIEGKKGANIEDRNSYTNFFPNFTLRYEPNKKTTLRAAYSTSVARPNYYWLVPYMNISTSDQNISLGNSNLKSTYAHNIDLIATYYPGNVASLSAGLFYKRLNNFIYSFATQAYMKDDFAKEYPERNNPIEAGEKWKYSTYRNGQSVDV